MLRTAIGSLRLLVSISFLVFYGCSKNASDSLMGGSNLNGHVPIGYFTLDPSKSPFYGDSVLYDQGNGAGADEFKPIQLLSGGHYVSNPAGLSIDQNTGVIDFLASEQGRRYNVGFVDNLTKDTAYRQITLAGLSFAGGVYFLEEADSILRPSYEGGSNAFGFRNVWNSQSGNGENNFIFDEQGPSGLRAIDQQVTADPSGFINLSASVRQGLFGTSPQNGASKQIYLYYRLNDNSRMTLQKTSFVAYYFNALSDVPASVIAQTGPAILGKDPKVPIIIIVNKGARK